jgi:hypothetical protein
MMEKRERFRFKRGLRFVFVVLWISAFLTVITPIFADTSRIKEGAKQNPAVMENIGIDAMVKAEIVYLSGYTVFYRITDAGGETWCDCLFEIYHSPTLPTGPDLKVICTTDQMIANFLLTAKMNSSMVVVRAYKIATPTDREGFMYEAPFYKIVDAQFGQSS